MAGDASDPRFRRVHADPRFRRARREDTKVLLDDRFKDVLSGRGTKQLDRFGRKQRVSEADELQRLYRLEQPDVDYARGHAELESSSEEESSDASSDESDGDVVIGGAAAVRRAQRDGDGDGDGDESDASIDLDEELDEAALAELDEQARQAKDDVARGDDTRRLAIVNMDWDHVRAADLFKVCASLVSPTSTREPLAPVPLAGAARGAPQALAPVRGQVMSVRVYLSDFGKERLAREDRQGPPREIFKARKSKNESAAAVDEGAEFDEAALRQYQLDRLRYYYAVATFDSAASARHVYNEIDGTEMERSANLFDLRFVPDDMELPDGEQGRAAEFTDEATEEAEHYEGLDFKTDALRHSKVRLTWDQDDPRRSKLTRAKHLSLKDDDLKTYLASSEEEEEADAQSRDRLRSLLTDLPKRGAFDDADDDDNMFAKPEGDMQISFMPALTSHAPADDHEETTLEKYKRKQKEKRERRRGRADGAAAEEAPAPDASLGFDDPFFADDRDLESALAEAHGEAPARASAKPKPRAPSPPRSPPAAGGSGDDDDDEDAQHFDLRDIVRAEKLQSKKLSKQQRRREAKRAAKRGGALVQPTFELDTQDPRFAAVMDDHRFAIDPSHPSFIKTQGMQKLMAAGRERHAEPAPSAQPDLAALVSSVKHKAQAPPRKKHRR